MGVIQKLHHHSDRYFRIQLVLTNGGTRATEEHRAIALAVQQKDVRVACQLMRTHILGAGQSLLKLLEAQRGSRALPADLASRG
jgi:DNA-binding GntR family transcriptional regulator